MSFEGSIPPVVDTPTWETCTNDCGVGPEIMLGLSGVVVLDRIRGKCAEGTFLDLVGLSGLVGFAGFLVEFVRERKGPKTVLSKN